MCSLYHHAFDISLDLETWEVKAKRWARVLFILIEDKHQSDTLLQVFLIANMFIIIFVLSYILRLND